MKRITSKICLPKQRSKKMAKNKIWLGALTALLTLALVFSACDGVQEITGTVKVEEVQKPIDGQTVTVDGNVGIEGTVNTNLSAIPNPVLTAEAVSGGVRLSWNMLIEAEGYTVYRKLTETTYKALSSSPTLDVNLDVETGVYTYYDLVSDSNGLTANTEYSYTVVAYARTAAQNNSKAEAKATPTNIPDKGTQYGTPVAVDFEFDVENNRVTVTVTPPTTGLAPISYQVALYQDTNYIDNTTFPASATTGEIAWSNPQSGSYRVQVTATGNSYYRSSDTVYSAVKTYTRPAPLFNSSAYINVSTTPSLNSGTNPTTFTGYYAEVSLNNFYAQDGVTYTVEKAALDANSQPGTWSAVSLKTSQTGGSNLPWPTLDVLGNPSVSSSVGYDQTLLPVTKASYQYRIKAVKGEQTEYRSGVVSVDPYNDFSFSSISVDNQTQSGTNKRFGVRPSISYKGILQANDKLVIYWVKGDSNSFQNGPYTDANSITFTKAELEAYPVVAKNIDVPDTGSGAYVFAQAYFVRADGTPQQNLEQSLWNTGNGVSGTGSYYQTTLGSYRICYYAQLDYFNPATIASSATALTVGGASQSGYCSSGGDTYFRFTATATTSVNISYSYSTLYSAYVQLYDSNGSKVGTQYSCYGSDSFSRSVTNGTIYYVKVTPTSSYSSGSFDLSVSN